MTRGPQPVPPRVHAHHASHTRLLSTATVRSTRPAGVNAVIVPTARPYGYLRDAAELVKDLNCQLIVLCSKWADAGRALDLAADVGVRVVTVDVEHDQPRLPDLRTSSMLTEQGWRRFSRRTDTSLKRNVGLALARMVGWRFVLFLDDDIRVEEPGDIWDAAALAETHAAVGLVNHGFPDNSVVCHAHRRTGGIQGTFVGGGALVVQVNRTTSFFPNIYNEDWFFLLNGHGIDPVTMVGKVTQKEYDPFRDTVRARGEEFGDTLAEGVYALLDDGKTIAAADAGYWEGYLQVRRDFIQQVLGRLPRAAVADEAERHRMAAALAGAHGRSLTITPDLCVDYLRAWAADRRQWQTWLGKLPHKPSAEAALRYLGLKPHVA